MQTLRTNQIKEIAVTKRNGGAFVLLMSASQPCIEKEIF